MLLPIEKLATKSTPNLLRYYRAKRREFLLGDNDCFVDETYLREIKTLLDQREHVERKRKQ